jgi:hypothetical protein
VLLSQKKKTIVTQAQILDLEPENLPVFPINIVATGIIVMEGQVIGDQMVLIADVMDVISREKKFNRRIKLTFVFLII